eukprot:NODE_164_length_1917_cov_370.061224.p1 GENE.NODE_164_length_1917_cov_370.061224~~NODE_164_length_1917_cov_370.061224.p1  ORF type:complete len:592 (+),score=206.31 NODE_164_length_1917_cov_370.061224:3-1778(+)
MGLKAEVEAATAKRAAANEVARSEARDLQAEHHQLEHGLEKVRLESECRVLNCEREERARLDELRFETSAMSSDIDLCRAELHTLKEEAENRSALLREAERGAAVDLNALLVELESAPREAAAAVAGRTASLVVAEKEGGGSALHAEFACLRAGLAALPAAEVAAAPPEGLAAEFHLQLAKEAACEEDVRATGYALGEVEERAVVAISRLEASAAHELSEARSSVTVIEKTLNRGIKDARAEHHAQHNAMRLMIHAEIRDGALHQMALEEEIQAFEQEAHDEQLMVYKVDQIRDEIREAEADLADAPSPIPVEGAMHGAHGLQWERHKVPQQPQRAALQADAFPFDLARAEAATHGGAHLPAFAANAAQALRQELNSARARANEAEQTLAQRREALRGEWLAMEVRTSADAAELLDELDEGSIAHAALLGQIRWEEESFTRAMVSSHTPDAFGRLPTTPNIGALSPPLGSPSDRFWINCEKSLNEELAEVREEWARDEDEHDAFLIAARRATTENGDVRERLGDEVARMAASMCSLQQKQNETTTMLRSLQQSEQEEPCRRVPAITDAAAEPWIGHDLEPLQVACRPGEDG